MAGPWDNYAQPVQEETGPWQNYAQTQEVNSPHPTAGPSGSELTDWKRKIGTAGTIALGALAGLPRSAAQGADWLTQGPGDRFMSAPMSNTVQTLAYPIGRALRAVQPEGGYSEAMGSIKAPGTNDPLFPTMPQAIEGAFQTTGATEYKPATWAGRRTMDALTGAATGIINPAAIPAGIGAGVLGGQAAETTRNLGLPESEQVLAGLVGGAAGAKVGQGTANLAAATSGMPIPFNRPVSATRADLARIASEKYGIPVRGAMVEGRGSPVRLIDSELNNVPLSGMRGSNESIQTSYNQAVSRTFGANAPELSPDVFRAAHTNLVNDLNKITPRLGIGGNGLNQLIDDVATIGQDFTKLKGPAHVAPINAAIDDILGIQQRNGGTIPGEAYHAMVKKGSHLDNMRNSADPDVRRAGGQIMNALEDAVETSMPAGSPALQDFRAWRGKWRSMRMAEDATDASGNVSGAKLNQVSDRSTSEYKSGGGGDIAELGRIGGALFPQPAQSNTAGRSVVWKALAAPATAIASAAGAVMHPELAPQILAGGAGMLATGAGVAGAGRAAGAYLRSPQYLNRAINTGLNPDAFRFQSPDMLQRAMLAKALADGANTQSLPR